MHEKQLIDIIRSSARYDFFPDLRIDLATIQDVQREFMAEGILAYKAPLNEVRLVSRY